MFFIGYSLRDKNILDPYLNFVLNCRPKTSYCVVRNLNDEIRDLAALGAIQPIYLDAAEFLLRLRVVLISKLS